MAKNEMKTESSKIGANTLNGLKYSVTLKMNPKVRMESFSSLTFD
jgi:hypothetical protein